MCLGIPMQIVEIMPPFRATVEVKGVQRAVSIALIADEDLKIGDWLMIHIGNAIAKLDENSANETLEVLEELSRLT
jgi:hydrogenase expression/formation protein HypC